MKPVICLVFVLLSVIGTLAQQKVIDKSEFDAIVKTGDMHRQQWAGKSYRISVATSAQIKENPGSNYSSKMTIEFASNGDRRYLQSSTFGDKTTSSESLTVGNWTYSRNGTEPWKRVERSRGDGEESGSETGLLEQISSVTQYNSLGAGEIKGRPVRMYLSTIREKKLNRSSGITIELVSKSKYWINADGLTAKNKLISKRHSHTQNTHNVILTEWELDPTIAITEPEISPKP
jgi:hypothetical protein